MSDILDWHSVLDMLYGLSSKAEKNQGVRALAEVRAQRAVTILQMLW